MGITDNYKAWKLARLLNRIPWLLSKDEFERSDMLLKEARTIFEEIPGEIKKKKPQLTDLLISMQKLLGGEFKRKLDKQLHDEVKIAQPKNFSRKLNEQRYHLLDGAGDAIRTAILGIKSQKISKKVSVKKPVARISKNNKNSTNVGDVLALRSKIAEWHKQGYDTSALEKQLPGLKK